MNKELGERIRRVRKYRELTREELSEITGISSKHIYSIESGKSNLTVDKLIKICNALSISTDYILEGKNDNVFF